jgi:hypothetical protein
MEATEGVKRRTGLSYAHLLTSDLRCSVLDTLLGIDGHEAAFWRVEEVQTSFCPQTKEKKNLGFYPFFPNGDAPQLSGRRCFEHAIHIELC